MPNFLIFDNIPNRIKKNKFLLTGTEPYYSKYYSGTDQAELFEQNLKTQQLNWYYRTNSVKYTLNSDGYRTREFKNINWAESVVIFGCSQAHGVGVTDEDTISSQLEKIIGLPVINMGVGGSSITYALHNASILRDGYPTPKAVINLWTGYDRTVYYNNKSINHGGSWNLDPKYSNPNKYMEVWSENDSHAKSHALFASKLSKWLWKDTRYIEASFFSDTSKLLNCPHLSGVDLARDLIHSGRMTSIHAAEHFAKELKLKDR